MIWQVWLRVLAALTLCVTTCQAAARVFQGSIGEPEEDGTRWALLMAGSRGYDNYRHQADLCHAYQLLKRGGLRDEHIVVMMYDDIAMNEDNPHKGKIFNKPQGPDVYEGVPKDYTGETVTGDNFYAILAGNRSAVKGGSGKVLATGPQDHVFVYYTDHGGPGMLAAPAGDRYIFGDTLCLFLRDLQAKKHFKSLLFYMEACESGSMFEGMLLHSDPGIYALTAANSTESSWATYCDSFPCIGDTFSVAWMEDTERHNRRLESLEQQFEQVKARTIAGA